MRNSTVIGFATCCKGQGKFWTTIKTLATLQQNSKFVFVIINRQCLTIRKLVNQLFITIPLNTKFVKLALLLLNKLLTTAMESISNNCFLPGKHTGLHNFFRYIHTALTKGGSSNQRTVSVTIVDQFLLQSKISLGLYNRQQIQSELNFSYQLYTL